MKKIFYNLLAAGLVMFSLVSCAKEELDPDSVISEQNYVKNDFDRWLYSNFLTPYNIRVQYRFMDTETNMGYYLSPADYEQSIALAHLIRTICIEPYDEVTHSTDFIRKNFPKLIFFTGSPAYTSNGSMLMGSAEGGMKITLYAVDDLNIDEISADLTYFKTLHHEFLHILHHKVPYTTAFNEISGKLYVGDSCWDVYPTDASALKAGFISRYSATNDKEDFVELASFYVTRSEAVWEDMMNTAGTEGKAIIDAKFAIVRNYMQKEWGINLDELRDMVLSQTAKVPEMDLYSLN